MNPFKAGDYVISRLGRRVIHKVISTQGRAVLCESAYFGSYATIRKALNRDKVRLLPDDKLAELLSRRDCPITTKMSMEPIECNGECKECVKKWLVGYYNGWGEDEK